MLSEEMKRKLSAIPEEEPDETDRQIMSETSNEKKEYYNLSDVKDEIKQIQTARKKKGDLHVRIAASLHEEIIDEAQTEGISLNQYVATALAYYAGRNHYGKA